MPGVAGNADDGAVDGPRSRCAPRRGCDAQLPSNGAVVPRQPIRQRSADDHDRRGADTIRIVEDASFDQRNLQHAEVPGAHADNATS
jgi:hypothetical protein